MKLTLNQTFTMAALAAAMALATPAMAQTADNAAAPVGAQTNGTVGVTAPAMSGGMDTSSSMHMKKPSKMKKTAMMKKKKAMPAMSDDKMPGDAMSPGTSDSGEMSTGGKTTPAH